MALSIQRVPAVIRELYAWHLAFIRMGFREEDLDISHQDPKKISDKVVYIRLCAQNKTFYQPIDSIGKLDREQTIKQWSKFFNTCSRISEKKLDILWEKSKIGKDPEKLLKLMDALCRQGFKLEMN